MKREAWPPEWEQDPPVCEKCGEQHWPGEKHATAAHDKRDSVTLSIAAEEVAILVSAYWDADPDALDKTADILNRLSADAVEASPWVGPEIARLRRVMAAALERTQVDDCDEATMILEAEVNLDGTARRVR